jgi:hypothetical protein
MLLKTFADSDATHFQHITMKVTLILLLEVSSHRFDSNVMRVLACLSALKSVAEIVLRGF